MSDTLVMMAVPILFDYEFKVLVQTLGRKGWPETCPRGTLAPDLHQAVEEDPPPPC